MEDIILNNRELRLARILQSGMDLVDAVKGRITASSKHNIFREALTQLKKLAIEESIPIALIGGAAVIHHGHEYSTKDIDISVSTQDFQKIARVAHGYGFALKTWNHTRFHVLDYKGIDIEVVQQETWGPNEHGVTVPHHPSKMGIQKGMGPISLAYLIVMKLVADRYKDYAAIVEVLKKKSLAEIQKTGEEIYDISPFYYDKFEELVKEAETEKARDFPDKVDR